MKNQKLKDLSKNVTESQIASLSSELIKTISGGIALLKPGDHCLSYSNLDGTPICATNMCWSY